MNMFSHGVDPKLNFSNLPAIREKYESFTRMHVYERQPYAGDLVFTAFSGSHQDAIRKGMAWREKLNEWSVLIFRLTQWMWAELTILTLSVSTVSLVKVA